MVRRLDGDVQIGRVNADLTFPASNVSRRQCRIFRKDGAWLLEDSASSSGTFLNEGKFVGAKPLSPGDRIWFGGVVMRVAEHFPEAHVRSDGLPELGAPIGDRLVMGDTWASDFRVRRERGHQGKTEATIVRDPWRATKLLDSAVVGRSDEVLRGGDRIRLGTRGVFRFHTGLPTRSRDVFFDSPLATLADLLSAEDPDAQVQALHLLDAVANSPRADEVLDALIPGRPMGPESTFAKRPPPLTFDEPALVGPRRGAFQLIALHLLGASTRASAIAFRESITRLWIGYVPHPAWWQRTKVVSKRAQLPISTEPLRGFSNLRELWIENASSLEGPPLPQVMSVHLLGCPEVDQARLFPAA